jgi:glycine/D-amino acid oxidase-like deaminating enzyme
VRCVVVGAGAWGLPAAATLARRGHRVTLVDRYGVANTLSSSPGPTRLWRLTHPDALRVRLARRSVEAMESLARRSGETVFLRRGLLWRDAGGLAGVLDALAAEDVDHVAVDPADVGRFLPGLVPDGRGAVWVGEAGPVLAAVSMRAQAALFAAAGGTLLTGREVVGVTTGPHGVRVGFADGGVPLSADVAVLATGPGSAELLAGLGVDLALRPRLEQVVHVGRPDDPGAADGLACLVDRHDGDGLGVYAMPTPGTGYKIGIEGDRPFDPLDRTPDPAVVTGVLDWVAGHLTSLPATAVDTQVCCWTDSPDHRFVIDRLPGGVVVACGDSGEGFKFSALMGPVLADLAEGATADADIAAFGLARFAPPAA